MVPLAIIPWLATSLRGSQANDSLAIILVRLEGARSCPGEMLTILPVLSAIAQPVGVAVNDLAVFGDQDRRTWRAGALQDGLNVGIDALRPLITDWRGCGDGSQRQTKQGQRREGSEHGMVSCGHTET